MSAPAMAVAGPLQYGAPELKRNYRRFLTRALIIAVIAHFTILGGIKVASYLLARKKEVHVAHLTTFKVLNAPPPLSKAPPPPVAVAQNVAAPSVGVPTPVPDAIAPKEQQVASQEEIQSFNPGAGSEGGSDSLVIAEGAVEDNTPKLGEFVYYEEQPTLINMPQPRYPDLARESGLEGTVMVQALISKDGRVLDTRVTKSIPMLDDAAVEAVRRSTWKPALSNSKPVAVSVVIPVRFTLKD
jgi:protein TonB